MRIKLVLFILFLALVIVPASATNITVGYPGNTGNYTTDGIEDNVQFWQKWTGTGWTFLNSTPTNNSASLDGQLEVTVS